VTNSFLVGRLGVVRLCKLAVSVLQSRKNLKYFPDNETRIVISHCQANGSCKNKNRKFTMKSMARPAAAANIFSAQGINIKHSSNYDQRIK